MYATQEQAAIDFYCYPPIGDEDWRYAFATAQVRTLDSMMLSRGLLQDIANAESFSAVLDLLSGGEYDAGAGATNLGEIEQMLMEKRASVRRLFYGLIDNDKIKELFQSRVDFSNVRLAVRRLVTKKPLGLDYCNEGSVPAEQFEEVFEQEDYSYLPGYVQTAVEEAVLGYYQGKDIRQIDYSIDRVQAAYQLQLAIELKNTFLQSLLRTQIDLTNFRTMLRLKMADREEKDLYLHGGFVRIDRFVHGFDVGYEAMAMLFYATPYHDVVEGGVSYLTAEGSFLRLERLCEEYLMGFLRSTQLVAAGPQPVIAYLLMKENEIRTVRMLLTCKKNELDAKLILDRLGE
jgi:V/A-type H+-transporting ATPase subunit C